MATTADSAGSYDAAVQLLSQINEPAHSKMALLKQEEKTVRERKRTIAKSIKKEKRRVRDLQKRLSKLPVADVLEFISAKVRVAS